MNKSEVLLAQLAEECSELSKECMKALRFGVDSCDPVNGFSNQEKIKLEFHDILAMYSVYRDNQDLPLTLDYGLVQKKTQKIFDYLAMSDSVHSGREQQLLDALELAMTEGGMFPDVQAKVARIMNGS
jgi:NTP pyrophosphatase (non-canonical NTP hydrolase)